MLGKIYQVICVKNTYDDKKVVIKSEVIYEDTILALNEAHIAMEVSRNIDQDISLDDLEIAIRPF